MLELFNFHFFSLNLRIIGKLVTIENNILFEFKFLMTINPQNKGFVLFS